MPETNQKTLTLRIDQIELLEDMADDEDPRYTSASEAARFLLDEAARVDDLERSLNRVQNEKEVLIREYQEAGEIVPADDDDDDEDKGLWGRVRWLLRGE